MKKLDILAAVLVIVGASTGVSSPSRNSTSWPRSSASNLVKPTLLAGSCTDSSAWPPSTRSPSRRPSATGGRPPSPPDEGLPRCAARVRPVP